MTASKAANLEYRKNLRKDKAKVRDRYQALLDAAGKPEDLTKEEMGVAARQEQLHLRTVIELEDMDEGILKLQNELAWYVRQTETVRRMAERSDTLKFRPFGKITM